MILLNILLQIIIGIKNINKFAAETKNAAKMTLPGRLLEQKGQT